jgi:hypothetical protein
MVTRVQRSSDCSGCGDRDADDGIAVRDRKAGRQELAGRSRRKLTTADEMACEDGECNELTNQGAWV